MDAAATTRWEGTQQVAYLPCSAAYLVLVDVQHPHTKRIRPCTCRQHIMMYILSRRNSRCEQCWVSGLVAFTFGGANRIIQSYHNVGLTGGRLLCIYLELVDGLLLP